MHQLDYYIERLSRINIFWSLHETGGLKIILKLEFQSYVFEDVRNKLVSAHCAVKSNVLTVTDENHRRCIFPILTANFSQSKSYFLQKVQTYQPNC